MQGREEMEMSQPLKPVTGKMTTLLPDLGTLAEGWRREGGGISSEIRGIYMESPPWSLEQKAETWLSVSG